MATLSLLMGGVTNALVPSLFSTTTCFFAHEPEQAQHYPASDSFCIVQPRRVEVKQRAWGTPKGNIEMMMTLELSIWLFSRLTLDAYPRDDISLMDQTYGTLALTDKVIKALKSHWILSDGFHFGYYLDGIEWSKGKQAVPFNITKLNYHTTLAKSVG